MTLADFARSIGISPATARQWKKRGKIVERDGRLELLADVQKRESLIGAEVVGGSGVTGKVIAATRDGFTVQTGRGTSVTFCGCGMRACTICNPSGRDTATDSAEDSHGREGADLPPESNRESCVGCSALQREIASLRAWFGDLTTHHNERGQIFKAFQHEFYTLTDRVAALEGEKAVNMRIGIDLSCLETRVKELEIEIAFLRTGLDQSDAPVALYMSAGGPIDPPGPPFGA